jgi:hypothetical protein
MCWWPSERIRMKRELWLEAKRLRAEGLRSGAIARRIGVSRRTVTRVLVYDEYPPQRRRPVVRPSKLDGYRGFLLAKLELYPELTAFRRLALLHERGYKGKYGAVKEYVRSLRPYLNGTTPSVATGKGKAGNPVEPETACAIAHGAGQDKTGNILAATIVTASGGIGADTDRTPGNAFVELEVIPDVFRKAGKETEIADREAPSHLPAIKVAYGSVTLELPSGFDDVEFKRALRALQEAS